MANIDSVIYTREAAQGGKPVGGGQGLVGVVRAKIFSVVMPVGAALNDVIRFGYMPGGSRVVDHFLDATDLDTGGPTITLDIGHAANGQQIADPDRFYAAAVTAQAAVNSPFRGPGATYPATGRNFKFLENTLITGLVKAAATTPAAGTLILTLLYTQEDFTTSHA